MNRRHKYGPWAVITGASEGIGAEFALRLADEQINSVLVARRQGPLDELAGQVRKRGAECITAAVDLTAPDATTQIAAAVGPRVVGLLIANGGADPNSARFLDSDVTTWEQLPHGPTYNWGQANDIAGYAPNSPDDRRARIMAIEQVTTAYLRER